MNLKGIKAFLILVVGAWAGWGIPPANWGDFKFGLVSANSTIENTRIAEVLNQGIKLDYRYIYLNNGARNQADTLKSACSWLFASWGNYSDGSKKINSNLKPAYVVYMLQEDVGTPSVTLAMNANDPTFMSNYFENIRIAAEHSSGMGAVFIVEPDTWGYALNSGITDPSNPNQAPARVNNLGGKWTFLSDLPNTYSGVAQAVIRVIHHYAPDAYAGVLMSFWAAGGDSRGLVWSDQATINKSALSTVNFTNKLLGTGKDRGDFIAFEKNGYSAGHYKWKNASNTIYYWNDQQNANWLNWTKQVAKGVNLPALGWQISIGHMGLRNDTATSTLNSAFEDTFFEYFFSHKKDYIDAGFIGILAGKGLIDDTDYGVYVNEGDGGWFINKLKEFDLNRPYLVPSSALFSPQKHGSHTWVNGQELQMPSGIFEVRSVDGRLLIKQAFLQGDLLNVVLPLGLYTLKFDQNPRINFLQINP